MKVKKLKEKGEEGGGREERQNENAEGELCDRNRWKKTTQRRCKTITQAWTRHIEWGKGRHAR